jgi:hypothetical protein
MHAFTAPHLAARTNMPQDASDDYQFESFEVEEASGLFADLEGWHHDALLDEVHEAALDAPPFCDYFIRLAFEGNISEQAALARTLHSAESEANDLPINEAMLDALLEADEEGEPDDLRLLVLGEKLYERDPRLVRMLRCARHSGDHETFKKLTRRACNVLSPQSSRFAGKASVRRTFAWPRSTVRARRGHSVRSHRTKRAAQSRAGPDDPGEGEPDPPHGIGRNYHSGIRSKRRWGTRGPCKIADERAAGTPAREWRR